MCKFGYKLDCKIHPQPLLNIFTKNPEDLSRNRQVTHRIYLLYLSTVVSYITVVTYVKA